MNKIAPEIASQLRSWIKREFPDYQIAEMPVFGTYGLIWFIEYQGQRLALKTLDPEKAKSDLDDLEYLKREFRLWTEIPFSYNTVPALGFKIATIYFEDNREVNVPVMVMKQFDGSLDQWVDSAEFDRENRLAALAQAFNGLAHLYENGLEGHGDLKPGNFLYQNLRKRGFHIEESNIYHKLPFNVCVADFGWVDAWVDYEFVDKCWLKYLAPERVNTSENEAPNVVPEKSDIFSMGIVVAELLLGRHPAPSKNVLSKASKWFKHVKKWEWELSDIGSERLIGLINRCLNPEPNERPTAVECRSILCEELEHHGIDGYGKLLELYEKEAKNLEEETQFTWDYGQSPLALGLGKEQGQRSINRLEERIAQIEVGDIESAKGWLKLAHPLLEFYDEDGSDRSMAGVAKVRANAHQILESTFANFDHANFDGLPFGGGSDGTRFENLGEAIFQLALVADLSFETAEQERDFSDLSMAAWALALAVKVFLGFEAPNTPKFYFDKAEELQPNEPSIYLSRARWRDNILSVQRINNIEVDQTELITDLEKAIELRPDWEEAQTLYSCIKAGV